jgi:hypothetical protein
MKARWTWWLVSLVLAVFVFGLLVAPAPAVLAAGELDEIVIEDQWIPMSDGVNLAAKIYRPKADGKYPTLLSRTPYNSGAFQTNLDGSSKLGDYSSVGLDFAKKDYVVVIQDVRGRYASEGEYDPYVDDPKDGNDTLEWIANHDWSDGNIGTFGSSARGNTQILLSDTKHPYLKAMFIIVAPSEYFEEGLFQGGAYRQELIQVWQAGQNVDRIAKKFGTDSPQYEAVKKAQADIPGQNGLYWFLPLREFPTLGDGYETKLPAYTEVLEHYIKDGTYDFRDASLKFPNIHAPAYFVGGWYDIYAEGTAKNFVGLQEKGGDGARGNSKLLMGPWQHRDVGNSPRFEGDEVDIYGEVMQRWFDYWLKGIDNGIMKEKAVRYFAMGSNQWHESDTWPVASSAQDFYLREGTSGSANSLYDGVLSTEAPQKEQPNQYIYDPSKPTITIGGQLLYPNVNIQYEKGPGGKVKELVGPEDQREAEKSSLTFTTAELTADLTIDGHISATIYASSDRQDTDFVVRLTDVSPDGTSTLIKDGIIRARFREGQEKEIFMEPGAIYPFEINLGVTSHTFIKGHRIRVAIASSNFPRFDRNANTGNPIGTDSQEDLLVATNTIYHDSEHPSHISLPVISMKSTVISVIVNGKNLSLDLPPVMEQDRLLVRLGAISEALGAEYRWEPATNTFTVLKDSTKVSIGEGTKTAYINNKQVKLDVPLKVINGNTFVPLRFISEALGEQVQWIPDTLTVEIK